MRGSRTVRRKMLPTKRDSHRIVARRSTMSIANPLNIVDRFRRFQRGVRDMIIRSRTSSGASLHEVSHSTAADTIYKIDTEVDPLLEAFCQEWGKETPLVLIAEGIENEHGEEAA